MERRTFLKMMVIAAVAPKLLLHGQESVITFDTRGLPPFLRDFISRFEKQIYPHQLINCDVVFSPIYFGQICRVLVKDNSLYAEGAFTFDDHKYISDYHVRDCAMQINYHFERRRNGSTPTLYSTI